MMKSLVSFVFTFIFTFTHTMAYAPTNHQVEIGKALDLMESNIDSFDNSLSEKEFRKMKKRMLKFYRKEKKRIDGKSSEEQKSFALKKLKRKFERMKRVVQFSTHNQEKLKRMAQKKGVRYEAIKSQLEEITSGERYNHYVDELLNEIKSHGSYQSLIQNKIDELSNLTYDSIANNSKNKEDNFRKPAQVFLPFAGLVLFILVTPITTFVLAVTFFILGAVTGGVGWFIGGTVLAAFLTGWILFLLVDANSPPESYILD